MKSTLLLIFVLLAGCQSLRTPAPLAPAAPLRIEAAALNGEGQPFEKHKNYLAKPLPYAPMAKVLKQLEEKIGQTLITRGESHVTILTPPEFDKIKKVVTIDEVNAIADRHQLLVSQLEPVCLGRGEAPLGKDKLEQTYFIVLNAPELLSIREEIRHLVVSRGSAPELFEAEKFYPHITVGFTKADLHESQGVIKDRRSCLFDLEVLAP